MHELKQNGVTLVKAIAIDAHIGPGLVGALFSHLKDKDLAGSSVGLVKYHHVIKELLGRATKAQVATALVTGESSNLGGILFDKGALWVGAILFAVGQELVVNATESPKEDLQGKGFRLTRLFIGFFVVE